MKSMNKFYEHKRRFDYGEAGESSKGKHKAYVKKRSHKRLRRQPILLDDACSCKGRKGCLDCSSRLLSQ